MPTAPAAARGTVVPAFGRFGGAVAVRIALVVTLVVLLVVPLLVELLLHVAHLTGLSMARVKRVRQLLASSLIFTPISRLFFSASLFSV